MATFASPCPNLYESSDGYSVEVLGRTGLRYREGPRTMFVDSEVLARPRGIVIYTRTISSWDPPHETEELPEDARRRVLDNILAALRSQAIDVELL